MASAKKQKSELAEKASGYYGERGGKKVEEPKQPPRDKLRGIKISKQAKKKK